MPDEDLIPYLLQRYLDDGLTDEELEALAALLRQYPDDGQWASRLQEIGLVQERDADYEEARWKPVLEVILRRRGQGLQGMNDPEGINGLDGLNDLQGVSGPGGVEQPVEAAISAVPVRRMPVRLRWVAAAIVLALAGVGGYWYRQQQNLVTEASLAPVADLAPGGNKAVLTLANGQHIILDSAADGLLAKQGNSKVQKLKNGALAYQAEGKTPAVILYNTLTTPRGGQYHLQLPDGSRVWLDAASSLTYPTVFTGNARKVRLSGQAYFEIVHHKESPFMVEVNGTEVKDIGTAFNINAYTDEPIARITVVEGSVGVARGQAKLVLQPGAQARIAGGELAGGELSVAPSVDVDEVVAWKRGMFQFDDAAIDEVMRQVARWYDVEIAFEGDVMSKHFSGGVARGANASELLRVLALTKSVRFKIEGNKIIVKPY